MPGPGEGYLVQGGVWSRGCMVWGVSGPRGCLVPGGCLVREGVPGGDPPPMATAVSGTHPTGMHSCFDLNIPVMLKDLQAEVQLQRST